MDPKKNAARYETGRARWMRMVASGAYARLANNARPRAPEGSTNYYGFGAGGLAGLADPDYVNAGLEVRSQIDDRVSERWILVPIAGHSAAAEIEYVDHHGRAGGQGEGDAQGIGRRIGRGSDQREGRRTRHGQRGLAVELLASVRIDADPVGVGVLGKDI